MDEKLRKVEVRVSTKDGKDQRAVPCFVEVDRGAGHVRMGGDDIICNSKDVKVFELRPGERLVIEGYTPEAIAFDREQAAAYRPDTQKGDGLDAPKPQKEEEKSKNEQTSQTGAKPSETQDSRIKSSPGTTVTPAMQSTPGANTGAPASTPSGAQIAGQPGGSGSAGGSGQKKDDKK